MKFPLTILLLIGFAAQTNAESDDASDRHEASDSTSIAGNWICVWDQRHGRPDISQVGTTFHFHQNTLVHKLHDGTASRWTFRLHQASKPKGIDWSRDKLDRTIERGIYWLARDTLVFCDGGTSGSRPATFDDAPHFNVLRRIECHSPERPTKPSSGKLVAESLSLQENAWVNGFDIVVSAKRNKDHPVKTSIQLLEGEVFVIQPDEASRWGAHGPDGPLSDYRGLGRTDSLLNLCFRVGESSAPVKAGRPITVISAGQLELYCQDNEPHNNIGEIAIKVIRFKTNK